LTGGEDKLSGRRVTVMGLGRFGGGVGVTRWLARQGARVTVSDRAPAEQLAESVAALKGLDVALHLGGHDERDFTGCDVLVINPAVAFDSPFIAAARRAGAELTTEINLFLARCPAPVVGITGSAGKSTTTAMAGAILAPRRPAHVGGNIGGSLLQSLDEIRRDHVAVLELSSFQLAWLPLLGRSPHVAVVTNLHPNHLDRHADMAEYADAKKNIFRFQRPGDVLVLNRDGAVADWAPEAPAKVDFFSADDEPFELAVPGRHNQANAQAAWAAARELGAARHLAAQALRAFEGLPHRMQLVAELEGVRYYNDSKCTTPEEALAAIESFPPASAVVIVGGYDKKVDFARLCAALAGRAKAVVATGETGEAIARGVEAAGGADRPRVVRAAGFDDAVGAARRLADSGDVVLLAPACASFDQFANFERRGEAFSRLVRGG
jgi:UDP-N-acetylmuramoylalanine--D-glutamate ligase